jgi:hypothetical protein
VRDERLPGELVEAQPQAGSAEVRFGAILAFGRIIKPAPLMREEPLKLRRCSRISLWLDISTIEEDRVVGLIR